VNKAVAKREIALKTFLTADCFAVFGLEGFENVLR
jgi:hypothetical protein